MKRISLTALAAGLLLATAAVAEPPHDEHHPPPHPGGGAPHPGGGAPHPHLTPAFHPSGGPGHGPMGGGPMHGPMGGGTHVNVNVNVYTGGRPNYQHDAHGFGMRPAYWNNPPRVFDRNVYQVNITVGHPFTWGVYARPSGWYYRRWVFGDMLPPIFWAQNYWIASWWQFDLPIPPYGFQWVRYGSDAILVNVTTGQVLQVQYGLFV
jgi:Ni/Co efflux regulator RcnB